MIGGLETRSGRPGSDRAVKEVCGHGVVAMDGVNVVKPSGYSVGKESGSGEPEAAPGFENVIANARLASRGRCGPAKGRRGCRCAGNGAPAPSTLCTLCPTRAPRGRTSRQDEVPGGRSLPGARVVRARIFAPTKAALVLAPLGHAVVGSPLWPRLSPNTMCAAGCVMPRLR